MFSELRTQPGVIGSGPYVSASGQLVNWLLRRGNAHSETATLSCKQFKNQQAFLHPCHKLEDRGFSPVAPRCLEAASYAPRVRNSLAADSAISRTVRRLCTRPVTATVSGSCCPNLLGRPSSLHAERLETKNEKITDAQS